MTLSRRIFLKTLGAGAFLPFLGCSTALQRYERVSKRAAFVRQWKQPPREFSQAPFWFWNDDLTEAEIARQMQDFCNHGVYGFVIHPRVGLPKSIGWMSERMIGFMRFAIEEAAAKDMWVMLYDEGMYPSGSASGQVVAEDPAFRPRGLFAVDLDEVVPGEEYFGFRINANRRLLMGDEQQVVTIVRRKTNGHRIAVLERPIAEGHALIRGLHYLEEDPPRRADRREVAEELPPLADILNPEAVECFIRLVYQRYFDEFGTHFGKTVRAIFTDEPSFFGKNPEKGAVPGNAETLAFVAEFLGEDFRKSLPALWFDDEPDAAEIRARYRRALNARLEETYYRPISRWCVEHGIELTGHPAAPDDLGHLRHFHIPGQDIVWRHIEPGKPSALEGAPSTQAKCASSAMIHLQRRRNANEFCGAYGHDFSFREMQWLANWLLVRGCNLLIPHAFYYSVRGPRIDERPPDVGPNSPWWGEFKPFADRTRRLCWLNTDAAHVCQVAVLGLNDYLPWQAAKICFEHQIDFNYLEARHLWEDAEITPGGIHIAGMFYRALIVEVEPPEQALPAIEKLDGYNRVIRRKPSDDEERLLTRLEVILRPDVTLTPPSRDIRVRHVVKDSFHCYIFFNEGESDYRGQVELGVTGKRIRPDGKIAKEVVPTEPLDLKAHELQVIVVEAFA